ncbi:YcjF family protein [Vibrio sp. ZSDE26]|uniref:YcjF family protein n=1 Tax=Vibrio amylolyticus TaxID=2847292 RepID=A0A9X2BJK2_9VIBR|nr:TIGR01620 family protein [Vibrio amylolyticus]MCK6261818.1 YcjF family protein [Vibrio amylolyticus]
MSDLKKKRVFNQTLESGSPSNDSVKHKGAVDLTAQQLLDGQRTFEQSDLFIPSKVEEEKPEADLERIIRPTKKYRGVTTALLMSFSGLLGWQAIDTVMTAISASDWLALGWAGFIATISALGIGAIGKELWKLRKLRHHFSTQEQSEAYLEQGGVGKAKVFCKELAAKSAISEENPHYDRWVNSVTDSHSDAEVIELYESIVVSQFDEKAAEIVTKHASESAVLVAVSPLAAADMALVAWRNFTMINSLATLYGVELGYWSRLSLFKSVLTNMAAAGASELAIDASMDLLSMDLAGKLSARAGQGIGVGILSARVGLKAIALLRPIAWQKENALTLSTIRKQIVSKVAAISLK